ncbi:LXG domain of WXG superfamily protein [Leifsonia sp. 98AMF]|nr:LXG domain of WXG superfamily protein [Leifsonia sp. 197AMF]SDJ03948.1 LXG domain of WXG superfamily protein [Leifsonia sp. 466MF]SDJ68732.1 LXG domain of WXG superfamily protein [Leifsonia sp. 157MF]SDO07803.1 LXG domain of WXG superfamily protein [Leifsonia sp. 509MF]SEM96040.1 LXG domain of WXG superfamily protein [Leifsonia sp. 467MF]SFM25367.1 LXG domain of WXG superfamily protein [Leifsonia sp. 98AMF]
MEAVGQLQQGLEALAASEKVSGQGADAMRAYIGEVHVPIVQLLQLGLSTFHTAIGVYWSGYGQVDSGGNFRLVRDEFQAHLAQLEGGMEQLRGFATQLRGIAAAASHLVSLGGAGAGAVEQTVNDLQGMHAIVKGQKEGWEAYEASDPGFGPVKDLIAQLAGIVNNVGALTAGQGRSYTAGSFTLTLQQLGPLTSGMLDYCTQNQKAATAGWESMFSGYAKDIEAAEAARREQAGWDLIWDGLQIVAGAVITVIGLGLTPFTGGVSLGLTVLGGSLLIGGINNAINHASIATTGNELNLAGMAGQWWDANVAQPVASWGGGWEFVGGALSGVGSALTGAAQLNVKEIGTGVAAIIADPGASFAGIWEQVTATVRKIGEGNAYANGQLAGEAAAVLIPGLAAAKIARAGSLLNKAGDLGATARLTGAQQTLLDELLQSGIKVSPEKVVTVMKTPEGRTVWLEEGKSSELTDRPSGLAHIVEDHGGEFAQKGIGETEIPQVLTRAIQDGRIVRYQGKGSDRPIHEFEYEGRTLKLAITISDNGYIVGANFSK